MSGKPSLEPITLSDEAAVRTFLVNAVGRPGAAMGVPDGWLAWMMRGAASAGLPDFPMGWKLMLDGEFCGLHLMMPFRVAAEGGEAISIQSAGYYVEPRWHGPASGALFMALVRHRAKFHCSVGTANAASAKVWQAFKAQEMAGSGEEYGVASVHLSLLEEAAVRRVKWLARLLPKCALALGASMPRRLAGLCDRLSGALTAHGASAVDSCAALPFHGPGAIPAAAMLQWRLDAPDRRHMLLALAHRGQAFAVFCTASTRGHRAQVPNLTIAAAWGPAWDTDPRGALELILTAARRDFHYVTVGFSAVPPALLGLLRRRPLDAPRRWLAASPAQPPPLPGWNGLDAL